MNIAAIVIIIAVGAVAVIESLSIFIKTSGGSSCGYTALIIIDPADDPEEKLESIFSRLRWTNNEMIQKIIIVNKDSNIEKNNICNRYCTKNPIAETINTDELLNLIISGEK